jgi:hypothetical protein
MEIIDPAALISISDLFGVSSRHAPTLELMPSLRPCWTAESVLSTIGDPSRAQEVS